MLICVGGVAFDFVKYDVMDMLLKRDDYLEASLMNVNVLKNEVFVFYKKAKKKDEQASQKRSIMFPFSLMYKSREYMLYDKEQHKILVKYDKLASFDKILLRASALDSIVSLSAFKSLGREFADYQKLTSFNTQTRDTIYVKELQEGVRASQSSTITISENYQISHDGIQLVSKFYRHCINGNIESHQRSTWSVSSSTGCEPTFIKNE